MSHDNFNEYCPKCHRRSLSTHTPNDYYEDEKGNYIDLEKLKGWDLHNPIKVRIHLMIGSATCTDCNYYRPEGSIEAYGEWIIIKEVKGSKATEEAELEEARAAAEKVMQNIKAQKELYKELKEKFEAKK